MTDALMRTYGAWPVEFVAGHGSWLVDADGREHLDFLSGLAVTSLGHAHPALVQALSDQAGTLLHVSNLFATPQQQRLAERLREALGWPDGRAFFCNSGAEANEAALKLARKRGRQRDPAKVEVVALEGSFHGRLLGALAITGNPAKRAPFEPLGGWARFVSHDDPDALSAAVGPRTCAVVLEVLQGEGGVRPVPGEVLLAAREACDAHDALLVVDEVQTGVGRTGSWFAFQQTPVVPDVVSIAKGLGGGVPIGAIVAHADAAEVFEPGDHATTFGGNPLACAAALAVLEVIAADGLLDHVCRQGKRLAEGVLALDHPLVAGERGMGLLRAVELAAPLAAAVTACALTRGLVVNAVAADAVRLAPPLNVTDDEVDEALVRLRAALDDAAARRQE